GADDGRAGRERWLDDLDDELPTGGVEQERVHEWIERRGAHGRLAEEDVADPLPEDGSTRFATGERRDPPGVEGRLEPFRLGCLARAFGSFERDEAAADRGTRVGHGPS